MVCLCWQIQGWGRDSPFSCIFQAQLKSRKVIDFHCLLCADLKNVKLSELCVPEHNNTELTSDGAPESSKHARPPFYEQLRRTSNTASPFTEESDSNSQEKYVKPELLENRVLSRSEQCTQNKSLPHSLQAIAPDLCLKDRKLGKVTLTGNLVVLPPVKGQTNAKPSIPNILKKDALEGGVIVSCSDTGSAMFVEENSDLRSTVDTIPGPFTSKHVSVKHQYHLLSELNIPASRRGQMPFSTLTDTLPHATYFSRNLRQDELLRSPLRNNSGHRPHSGIKARTLRKQRETELPILLGTRVLIPVSTQRLL